MATSEASGGGGGGGGGGAAAAAAIRIGALPNEQVDRVVVAASGGEEDGRALSRKEKRASKRVKAHACQAGAESGTQVTAEKAAATAGTHTGMAKLALSPALL